MRVQLQVHGLWDAVNEGDVDDHDDRAALSALLRAVPPELVRTLAAKDNAKAAWDTLKMLRVGAERVREAKAQTRRRDYDRLAFKDGETVEEFGLRLSTILSDLEMLGDPEDERKAVRKFLRVLPRKYRSMANSIESLLDLKTMSIEELSGRLLVVEENDALNGVDDSGQLLLTEEQWRARHKKGSRDVGGSSSGGDNRQGKKKGRDDKRPAGPKRDDECHYCGKKGHWAKECRKKKRDEEAHLAKLDDDGADPALLFAEVELDAAHPASPPAVATTPPMPTHAVTGIDTAPMAPSASERALVFLNEEKAKVVPGRADDPVDATWYLDTGASNHMTGDRSAFVDLDETVHGNVKFGDGSVVQIMGRGTIAFSIDGGPQRAFSDVFYIPKLKSSVVSLGQLDKHACDIRIRRGVLTIRDRRDNLIIKVKRAANRLYKLTMRPVQPVCLALRHDTASWLWHARFGHLHVEALQKMGREEMVRGMPGVVPTGELCEACLAGKQRRTPFPKQAKFRAEEPLELVHADLCGAISPPTPGGRRYFLLLVDDHSRFMWLVLLATKDGAAEALKRFQAEAQTEARRKLRTLRTDRGGEFTSNALAAHFAHTGVKRHLTAPYAPQQNGVVERRNQTVVGMARSMMKAKKMPNYFWGEAVTTAVYVLNRAYTSSVDGRTPYEAWHGKKPTVEHLRVFGCVAHVKSARPFMRKMDDRSTPMVFIGYEPGSKAYRVYHPATRRVHITRDVVFDESASWDWDGSDTDGAGIGGDFVVDYIVTEPAGFATNTPGAAEKEGGKPATAGRSSSPFTPADAPPVSTYEEGSSSARPAATEGVRFATPPTSPDPELFDVDDDPAVPHRYRRMTDILGPDAAHPGLAERNLLISAEEPASIEEALKQECWRAAMKEELDSIEENSTWSFTDLPHSHKAIGLKWVFKVKRDEGGAIVKYKARLVAKGYVQRAGIDFEEVFAPVARLDSVRLLLAIAAQESWEVHHLDVKSAFLNGDLEEEAYVEQPPGFVKPGKEGKVLRLKKALYGLRQAPRAWNAKLDSSLAHLGFVRCPSEHAVYTRGSGADRLLLGVYVDDLIITGASTTSIGAFKKEMMSIFKMSDLGLLSYYLGIEVIQEPGRILLCQAAYVDKILEKAGLDSCNPVAVPMEQRLKLSKQGGGAAVDGTLYRSIVGSLRYLVHTRPDICYAVGYVSRFMEAPTSEHWSAVKHLLRYIAGTRTLGCCYARQDADAKIVGYSDADMAGDVDDRKSTSGVLYFLGRCPITWQSAKQKIVVLSSCEAEYVAATAAACQGVWLKRLYAELRGHSDEAVELRVDNKSAIALMKNPVFHDRSKHIQTRFHFIRQCVDDGDIDVQFVRTEDQLSDIMTKALGRVQFLELRTRIGIVKVKDV